MNLHWLAHVGRTADSRAWLAVQHLHNRNLNRSVVQIIVNCIIWIETDVADCLKFPPGSSPGFFFRKLSREDLFRV
jgi:hypothetical protein